MSIEILEDWNAQLGCCCGMPSCPQPIEDCEFQSGSESLTAYWPMGQPAGTVGTDEVPRLYKDWDNPIDVIWNGRSVKFSSDMFAPAMDGYENKTISTATATSEADQVYAYSGTNNFYDPPGTCQSDTSYRDDPPFDGDTFVDSTLCVLIETKQSLIDRRTYQSGGTEPSLVGCPGPFSDDDGATVFWYDFTRDSITGLEVTDPFTSADLAADAIADYSGEWADTGSCEASLSFSHGTSFGTPGWPIVSENFVAGVWRACADAAVINLPIRADATKVQVQFKVPITHLGTFFAITFDVIEEPEGWDDVTIFRTFYAEDVLREWTGPGTGDQDDPSWLLGAVYDIPAPTTPGVRRIVNRRYWCYPNSPFGFKPQIYGEGAEIVTPP